MKPGGSKRRDPSRTRAAFGLTQTFVRCLFQVLFGLKIEGRENVPKKGAFILACNHKSWFDPPIVGSCSPRELFFAAKRELFHTPILGPVVKFYNSIPVRRRGFDREALTLIGQRLDEGFGVIIFPEGARFKDDVLHPPKPGVGMLALTHNVPIVPACVVGSAQLRRQLFGRGLVVRFGESYHPQPDSGDPKRDYHRVAGEVIRRIAQLGGFTVLSDTSSPPE